MQKCDRSSSLANNSHLAQQQIDLAEMFYTAEQPFPLLFATDECAKRVRISTRLFPSCSFAPFSPSPSPSKPADVHRPNNFQSHLFLSQINCRRTCIETGASELVEHGVWHFLLENYYLLMVARVCSRWVMMRKGRNLRFPLSFLVAVMESG